MNKQGTSVLTNQSGLRITTSQPNQNQGDQAIKYARNNSLTFC